MSNSDFLATAFVQIKPRVTGFQAELRKQIKTAVEPIKPTVNVLPTTKGFQAELRKQVNAAIKAIGSQKVPVKPVLTSFRREMQKELASKPIPVVVTPVQKGGITTGAAAGRDQEAAATAKLTAEERKAAEAEGVLSADRKSRISITAKLREVEILLSEATRQGLTAAQQDALVTKAQTISRQALLEVTLRQAGAEGILREEQLRARALAVGGKVEKFSSRLKADVAAIQAEAVAREEATAVAKAEQIEIDKLANVKARLAVSEEKSTAAIRSALSPSEKLEVLHRELSKVDATLEKITLDLSVAQITQNETRAESLGLLKAEAAALAQQLKLNINRVATNAQANRLDQLSKKIRADQVAILNVEIKALTEISAVKAHESKITAFEAEVEEALTLARNLGIGSIEKELVETERLIGMRLADVAAQKQQIAASALNATQLANLRRGMFATALSFLGARGATLAAGSSFLIGAAAIASFAKALQSAVSFETNLNVFQATAGATADEMARVSATAKQLGADITLPAVGANDAAEAMTQLAKAGLNVEDAMAGARGTLQLATAAQLSNAEATELVASALNAFGLAGTDATKVADLLTGAANAAQGSISDMGIALQQSSAVARQAGLSLEDTVAFITLLAKNGIRGSDAGTSLRTALLRLIAPTEDANKALHGLGIEITDLSGNVRPEAFSDLQKALSGLDSTARNQTLRKIFGQDAIRAAVIFGREGTKGLNDVRAATQQAGLASSLARARTKGFAGQVEALKNQAQTTGLTIGKLVEGPLSLLLGSLQANLKAVNLLIEGLGKLGGIVNPIIDFGKAVLDVTGKVGVFLDEATRGIPIVDKFFDTLDQGDRINKQSFGVLKSVASISKELQKFEGPQEAITFFEKMRDQLTGTGPEVDKAREKFNSLISLILGLNRLPTTFELHVFLDDTKFKSGLAGIKHVMDRTTFPIQLQLARTVAQGIIDAAKATGGDAGTAAAIEFAIRFGTALPPEIFAQIMKEFFSGIPKLNPNLIRKPVAGVTGLSGKEILGRIAGFDRQKVHAELSGATEDLLAVLRDEQAFLESQLKRAIVKKNPALRTQIESALVSVQDDIESIAEGRATDAKDAADKIKDANTKADKIILSAFESAERKLINRETLLAENENLKDDLVIDKAILRLYIEQRKAGKKRLKDKEDLAAFLKAINQKIFDITLEIKRDRKALNAKLKATQREAREKVVSGLELDIELAEINENRGKEISLRRKLIKALEDQIKHEKGNTLKIKELRNEIARQRQAIKDATEEQNKKNQARDAFNFSFLQTQAGFAANLLGNLIPLGATGGLVGGRTGTNTSVFPTVATTPTTTSGGPLGIDPLTGRPLGESGRGPSPATNLRTASGTTTGGPSKGGQQREIHLLNEIRILLQNIYRGTGHPEAHHRRRTNANAMDFQGGV